MELADRTVMLLGGSGLVGHAVARRVLATTPPPRRLVLVALYEDEVRAAARALEPYRSGVTIDVEWGNIFAPASVARLDLAVILASDDHRALVLGDLLGDLTDGVLERSLVLQLLVRYKPEAVVDSINTATAFAYLDIFQSARALLERAQDGGVDRATIERHLMRLPMPQLIRHAQIMTEALRRAGTQAYVKIGTSGTGGMGFNIPDCEQPVALHEAFRQGAAPWRDLGRPLDGVYIDVGENGLFARDEFETVTALGQMEFITPEEVADYVMLELQGRPTGKDIVAALDASTAGPTYRAGLLRRNAVGRLRALEARHGDRGVAYEMLGPPRLTKLLYEAYLCRRLRTSVRALADSRPAELAAAAELLLADDTALRQHIISVGLPVVLPDGKRVYRGSTVVVPPGSGDPLQVAPRGWVDLRPDHFGIWVKRAGQMVRQADARAAGPQGSGSDMDWNAIDPDEPIEPSRFATWVFTVEEKGTRIKR